MTFGPRIRDISLLLSLLFFLTGASAQISVSKIGEYRVTDEAMPMVFQPLNLRSHQDDAIVSFNGYQYCVYYSVIGENLFERFVTIGRRALPEGQWEEVQLLDYTQVTNDSHNVIAIGIDEKDGTIHLAFDHHNNLPGILINYRVSIPGLAADPTAHEWLPSKFGPAIENLPGLDANDTRGVTYPRFLNRPDGGLQLCRRRGSAVNGRLVLYSYDANIQEWTRDGFFIDGTVGSHGIPSPGPLFYENSAGQLTRLNGFLHGLTYGGERLHATWVWRSTGGRNFDFMYAYSDDFGQTWNNNAGEVAGTVESLPMLYRNDPSVKIFDFPDSTGLANQTGQAIDQEGRVHIVQRQSNRFLHLWRDLDGVWKQRRITNIAAGRNKITTDRANNVYLITPSAVIYAATPESDFTDWQLVYSADSGRFVGDAQFDEARMMRDGVLSLILGSSEQESREMFTIDLAIGPMIEEQILTYGNDGTPGSGSPWPVASSGVTQIEAENFNQGDNENSYFDTTIGNQGEINARPDSDVDIQLSNDVGGGAEIGLTTEGEYVQYTVEVARTGFYEFSLRYSNSSGAESRIQLLSDGTRVGEEYILSPTAGLGDYRDSTQRIVLQSGIQVLRLLFFDGGVNLNHLRFTPIVGEQIELVVQGVPASLSDDEAWSDGLPAHSGADYLVPQGGQLLSDLGSSVFPGFSLTVEPGGSLQVGAREDNQEVFTIDRLVLDGAVSGPSVELRASGEGDGGANVLSGSIVTSGRVSFSTFDRMGDNSQSFGLRILSSISGEGRIEVSGGITDGGGARVSIENAENTFSGIWVVRSGSDLTFSEGGSVGPASIEVIEGGLQIGGNWNGGALLAVRDASEVTINFDRFHWSVETLELGSTLLPDGVHRVSDLNALSMEALFVGTGSITVGDVAPGGPIAQWTFDEGDGVTANDVTGLGHTGTLLHGPQWAGDEVRSSYLSFDGNDDRVSTLFTYALASAEDFTWTWWANQQSAGDLDRNAVMVGNRFGGSGSEALEFIKFTPTKGEFRNDSNAAYDYENIVLSQWNHYAMVKTGSSYQWYVNGEAEGGPRTLNYTENDLLPFQIGGNDDDAIAGGKVNEHFRGFIDDVALFDRALSAEELALVFDSSMEDSPKSSPLEAWRRRYFGSDAGLGLASDLEDADGDGELNLLEFATGQDPNRAGLLVTPLLVDDGTVTFRYIWSNGAVREGVNFEVLWSNSLEDSSWSSSGVSEEVIHDDGTTQTVLATVARVQGAKLFLSLRVSL